MDKDKKAKTGLRERILEHLGVLRIPMSAENLELTLATAEKEGLAHLELLDRLLGHAAARRRERAIQRRVDAAHFAERQMIETFDWKFNKTIDRTQIEGLASGDFIKRAANLIMVGQSGVGKSHLVQAVGLRACSLGFRVLYTTSSQILAQLTASLADKTLAQSLKTYLTWDLLIIDEFAFDRIERDECPRAAHLLYKVIAGRHQKRSTAVVTNLDFDQWAAYLGDAPLAMALLDRLVEAAVVIKIKGPSYRASRSPKMSPAASP